MTATAHVSDTALRKLCTLIQMGFGVPEPDAAVVSDCLVDANLMGLDTHGVIRLKFYMDRIEAGGNNPRPNLRTIRDGPATALLDADNALGPVGGKAAMDLALSKAETIGIGAVAIRHCNPLRSRGMVRPDGRVKGHDRHVVLERAGLDGAHRRRAAPGGKQSVCLCVSSRTTPAGCCGRRHEQKQLG